MDLKETKALVRHLLSRFEDTRNNDMLLYLRVCVERNQRALTMPFYEVVMHLKELNLPPFESVRRARQKLQAKYPELAACETVQEYRAENEAEYRDFARGGV